MSEPELVFFDMDHTVLHVDCDFYWKIFLADRGLAPEEDRELASQFLQLYHQGQTPLDEFLLFQLREFVGRSLEEMRELAQEHFEAYINGHVFPEARHVIESFTAREVPTALLTGTNRIIAEPVAAHLDISHLLATELELIDERFTGLISGPYLSKEGKVERAVSHCQAMDVPLERCAFFADSINDLQLLEMVGWPVTVNPKQNLREVAEARDWRIVSWTL